MTPNEALSKLFIMALEQDCYVAKECYNIVKRELFKKKHYGNKRNPNNRT